MEKLKLKEKIGYGLGDAASSMFWKLFSMYLLFFYTDVFGIPAAAAGTMFLLTRIWDTANDPIMGIVADRTNSRWGKFRPYLLWMALPFGIMGVFLFTTPNLGTTGKIIYAYITYTLMMMVYTGVNVPYAALMGVMTPDSKQRTSLASFRMVFAFGGSLLVLAAFQPLFDTFGSKSVGNYTQNVVMMDSVSNDSGNILLFTNDLTDVNDVEDSLLVLSVQLKTTSTEFLKVGLFYPEKSEYAWVEFPAGTDTLGLRRDGTWSSIKIKLVDLVKDKDWLEKPQNLNAAILVQDQGSIEVKHIDINEINYQKGTQRAVMVVAIVAVILFFFTFYWTRERVNPIQKVKSSVKEDFKDLLKNRPWFILLGAGVSTLIFNSIRDGAAIYYFRYFIQNENALDMRFFGIALPIALSTLYLVLGQAANIVGVILAKPISDRLGKRQTFLYAMLLASVMSCVFYFFDRNTIILVFVFQFLISICAGIIFPLLWSMYADIVDYSEWKTGNRTTGLIFSSSSMSQKLGWTLGGALTGWILALYGFKADAVQTEAAQNAIRLMLSVFPAIGAFISVLFISIYKLSDTYMLKINGELNQRRLEK